MSGAVFVYPSGAVVVQASGVLVDQEAERKKEVGTFYDSILGTASMEWVRSLVGYASEPESAAVSLQRGTAEARTQTVFVQVQTRPAVPPRNQAALRLLREWLADPSGYDQQVWPALQEAIEEHRLSDRRRFGE